MATMLIKSVPEDLRKAFKLLCMEKDTTMSEAVREFMRKEIEKARKRKKK